MIKKSILATLFLICMITTTTAQIIITQPSSIYNYEDNFDLEVIIKGNVGEKQSFSLDLICNEKTKNLMDISQLWLKDGEKTLDYSLLLSKSYLEDIKGNCRISAKYGNEIQKTSNFIISDKINISLNQVNITANPGDTITMEGTAIKENGENANGFVDLSLKDTNLKNSASLENGEFSISLNIPPNIKSGKYIFTVFVYEKQINEITNLGEENSLLNIKQIPKSIIIETNKQEILPIEDFIFSVIILDQANDGIKEKVAIKVFDTKENIIYQELVDIDEKIKIDFPSNPLPGEYKIEAKAFSLSSTRNFNVKDYEKINFKLINSTLNIKNIGNVFFNKSLQISIGEETRIIELRLNIDEEKNFTLSAPNGEYDIVITDGYESFTANRVSLTGAAISIEEIKTRLYSWKNHILVWFFIMVLIIAFVMVIFKRTQKISYKPSFLFKERGGVEKIRQEPKKIIPTPEHIDKNFLEIHAQKAQYEIELKGKEENVSIFSIKFDNPSRVSKINKETFDRIINEIKESKGAIYQSNDYLIPIYTVTNTKSFENDKIALRTAEKISLIIKEHNKKYKEKINAGISLHTGKMIIKKDEKIRFSPLGNILSLSKRLSEASLQREGIILISEDLFKKRMSVLKAERINIEGIIAYSLEKEVIREDNDRFIRGFLKRNNY